jgi:hypothetical protein
LADAEKALFDHGWFPTKLDAYDQRYYRTWMHELPPMLHLDRGTNLDLHHTILPPTASLKPDVEKLWAEARTVEGQKYVLVLSVVDMILHSATHLFHDGEFEHGLRDLVDIDALLRQGSVEKDFWSRLIDRACALNLARPLHYALKYCREFLDTPMPEPAYADLRRVGSPGSVIAVGMDLVVRRSLGAILEETPSIATRLSQTSMYVRSHYLRMPMHLLIPHLLHQQFRTAKGEN